MISSIKHSPAVFAVADLVRFKPISSTARLCALPPKPKSQLSPLLSSKPLYLTPLNQFRFKSIESVQGSSSRDDSFRTEAFEADRSEGLQISDSEARSAAAQKVKIGIYFATWWALNVVFNIYNKKVLNAFPYPWLTSTLSLACGSLMMLVSWALRIAEAPKTDFDFWKALAPVRITL